MIIDSEPTTAAAPRSARFLPTSWTMILAAGGGSNEGAAEREKALSALLRQYAPTVQHYVITRFGFSPDEAEDLVQGFVLDKVLKRDLIGRARRERGKFRTFLLHAVNQYVFDHLRSLNAKKRIPQEMLVALDADGGLSDVPSADPGEPGAEAFDLAFVRQVLAEAVQRCHEHCRKRGMMDVWNIFHHRVLAPVLEGSAPRDFEQVAQELGLASSTQAHNRLVTAKRMFRRELRMLVIDYSETAQQVDEEIAMFRRLLEGN